MDDLRNRIKALKRPDPVTAKYLIEAELDDLVALIASCGREAELKGQIKAYRHVPQIEVDLEKWLWEQIDPLEAELKALGGKPEGKPNE